MTKVLGYLRVSSEEQAKSGNGLSGQQGAIEDFCKKEQFEIVKFYSDGGVSGKYSSRKALDEMLNNLKAENKNPLKPTIQYVIVDDIDRLARDVEVRFSKKREIETTGARVLSLKQQLDDTPEAHLMSTVSMATKQYERENGGRRVKSRQEQRMKDGYWCFPVPLGYKFEKAKDGHGKVVVPDEPAFSVIKEGLQKLASGVLISQDAFCKFLMDNGIKSKRGNKIHKSFAGHLLSPEHLALYAGFIYYPPWGIENVSGKHEAAITEYEFNILVQKFKVKGFYKEYSQNYITEQLPLRQVLCCGECGHPLTGAPSKGHGGVYYYYICNNKKCCMYKKSFLNRKVHDGIQTVLNGLSIDERLVDAITILCKYYWDEKQSHKKQIYERLVKEKEKVDKEVEKLLDLLLSTSVDNVRNIYEKRIEELGEKSKELELKIMEHEELKNNSFEEDLDGILAILKNPLSIWKEDDVGLKKILITSIFEDGLLYSRDKGIRTSKIPSVYLVSQEIGKISEIRKKGDIRTSFNSGLGLNKITSDASSSQLMGNKHHGFAQMVGDIGLEPMTPCL